VAGRPAQLLALTGAAADHPVALDTPEGAYLKVAWLRMGDAEGA
jgi:23S rRNA (cytosine1962-C5)-methyltransferase